jgi:hypothetical protein
LNTTRTHPGATTSPRQRLRTAPIWPRRIYIGLAALFLLGVAIQAFLAGAGIFVSAQWVAWHRALGHMLTSPIPLIPLLLIILSFAGRLPRSDKWLTALLFFLALMQPVVLYLRRALPLISALHPVNALLLFILPIWLIVRVRRAMRAAALELGD